MSQSIRFKNRKLSDLINQKLLQLARRCSKFDVDLVAANGGIVRAHRIVLSMYSKFLRRLLAHSAPENKIIGRGLKDQNLKQKINKKNLVPFFNFVFFSS